MQRRVFCFGGFAMAALVLLTSCGSTQSTQQSKTVADEYKQPVQEERASVNCDEFMKQMADDCFLSVAFGDDNETPRHEYDEAGNDLGEVDPRWAAGFCECYAQLAFQTFGCTTVLEQMTQMDDNTLAATYDEIISICEEPPEMPGRPPMEGNFETEPGEEVAPDSGAVPADEEAPASESVPAEEGTPVTEPEQAGTASFMVE